MRQKNIIRLLLILGVGILGACTQEASDIALPLDVSAEIGNTHTRADDHASDYDKRSFVTGDVIKITKSGGTSANYKRTAKGAWTPVVVNAPMETTGSETFTATFPIAHTGILSDQRTYTNFWLSNLLSDTKAATANRVSFSFAPAHCKISVIVIFQAGVTDNTANCSAEVAGTGIHSGTAAATGEAIQLLNTSLSDTRHTYAGIFSPKAATRFVISVTAPTFSTSGSGVGTKTYTETGDKLTLKPGYEYQYTFTATSQLILTSVVVTPFAVESGFGDDTGTEDAGNAT